MSNPFSLLTNCDLVCTEKHGRLIRDDLQLASPPARLPARQRIRGQDTSDLIDMSRIISTNFPVYYTCIEVESAFFNSYFISCIMILMYLSTYSNVRAMSHSINKRHYDPWCQGSPIFTGTGRTLLGSPTRGLAGTPLSH